MEGLKSFYNFITFRNLFENQRNRERLNEIIKEEQQRSLQRQRSKNSQRSLHSVKSAKSLKFEDIYKDKL